MNWPQATRYQFSRSKSLRKFGQFSRLYDYLTLCFPIHFVIYARKYEQD